MTSPPVKYVRQADYTGFEAAHPTDTKSGASLDADFGAALLSNNAIIDRLAQIQRSDGALANLVVTPDSLNASTLALMLATGTVRGAWLTLTVYAIKDLVSQAGLTYIAVTAHTSGVFATDLAAGKWLLLSLGSDLGAGLVMATGATALRSLAGRFTDVINLKDYGAVCDGATNDYAAIMAAHDNAPDGAVIFVRGAVRFTSPLVFTRRISWVCPGVGDYFKPALTTAQDAITVTGSSSTLPINMDVNIYGLANCCSNGLVLRNVHYSNIRATIKVGAANYSVKLLGCLLSDIRITSSVNFTVPLAAAGLAAKHVFVDFYNAIAHNANYHKLLLEGGGSGVTIADQAGQGDNTWTGTIEGITGAPFTVTGCYGMRVRDVHLEANSAPSIFTSCNNLRLEGGFALGCPVNLVGCNGAVIDNWAGGLSVDATSNFTHLAAIRFGASDVLSNLSATTITEQGISLDSSPATLNGASGAPPMENIFFNPYCDVWSAGAAAAPDGWSAGAATFARNTGTVYPGNPAQQSVAVTSTATTLPNMARAVPEYPYQTIVGGPRWVSAMVPIYIATGQPNLTVYIFDGASYQAIGTVTQKDSWIAVRGSVLAVPGTLAVVFAPDNGAFVAGNFFVGGLSIVYGTVSPQSLCEGRARLAHAVTAVGYQPSQVGQMAYVSGTGKWYLAKGVASSADWIILN